LITVNQVRTGITQQQINTSTAVDLIGAFFS